MLRNALRSFTLSALGMSALAATVVTAPLPARAAGVCGDYVPPIPMANKDYLSAAPADVKTLFDTIKTKVYGTTGFTFTVVAHETKGAKIQDRTYHFAELCPSPAGDRLIEARAEIAASSGYLADTGGVGYWQGGLKIKGHQGGELAQTKIIANLNDPRGTSMYGRSINESVFPNMLLVAKTLGPIKELAGQTISIKTESGTESHACKVFETTVDDPTKNHGITSERIYIDPTNDNIVRHEGFIAGQLVETEDFSAITPTSSLTPADFELK